MFFCILLMLRLLLSAVEVFLSSLALILSSYFIITLYLLHGFGAAS